MSTPVACWASQRRHETYLNGINMEDRMMQGVAVEEIRQLVAVIDYSEVLNITASEEDVRAACRAARNYRFRAVVAFPQYLGILVDELKDSGVRAQIPVGFPCGGQPLTSNAWRPKKDCGAGRPTWTW